MLVLFFLALAALFGLPGLFMLRSKEGKRLLECSGMLLLNSCMLWRHPHPDGIGITLLAANTYFVMATLFTIKMEHPMNLRGTWKKIGYVAVGAVALGLVFLTASCGRQQTASNITGPQLPHPQLQIPDTSLPVETPQVETIDVNDDHIQYSGTFEGRALRVDQQMITNAQASGTQMQVSESGQQPLTYSEMYPNGGGSMITVVSQGNISLRTQSWFSDGDPGVKIHYTLTVNGETQELEVMLDSKRDPDIPVVRNFLEKAKPLLSRHNKAMVTALVSGRAFDSGTTITTNGSHDGAIRAQATICAVAGAYTRVICSFGAWFAFTNPILDAACGAGAVATLACTYMVAQEIINDMHEPPPAGGSGSGGGSGAD